MQLVSVTESGRNDVIATTEDFEDPTPVSLFKVKKKRPLIDPGRKDTFGLMEMKKLTHADADGEVPNTVNATTSSVHRHKAKAIDLRDVGEEDEESGEDQSLIHVENQVHGIGHHKFFEGDDMDKDLNHLPAGSIDR